MNIITSSSTQAYTGSSNSSEAAPTNSVANSDKSNAEAEDKVADSVQISTRSQKIQELSQEFFPGGAHEITITSAFISRLQEYELISASEAEALNSSPGLANEERRDNLGQLGEFVDSFTDKLRQQEGASSLIETLENANSILQSWQESSRADSETLTIVVQELADLTASEGFSDYSVEDRRSLLELELAMNVAQKLNPDSNVSAQVNQYLSILKGS